MTAREYLEYRLTKQMEAMPQPMPPPPGTPQSIQTGSGQMKINEQPNDAVLTWGVGKWGEGRVTTKYKPDNS